MIGPGVAQECVETKDGLTVWEDHFYPEIVDPESGEALPDGEKGELVLTSLTKEALPVIRYRTRDLTRLLPGSARTMRRMEKITGRSDDMLIIRGVNVFPSQIEELVLKQAGLAPHYVLELTKQGPLDHLAVIVEGDAAATSQLRHAIKAIIGISADVRIGTVERSIGKAKRVIDKRSKSEDRPGHWRRRGDRRRDLPALLQRDEGAGCGQEPRRRRARGARGRRQGARIRHLEV